MCLFDKTFECKNNIWKISKYFTSKFEPRQLIIIISEVDQKEPHALIGQQVSLKSFFFFN